MTTVKYHHGFSSLLHWLIDGYWPDAGERAEAPAVVRGPTRSYTLQKQLAVGDVADIYLAAGEGDLESEDNATHLLKIASDRQGAALLDNEQKNLQKLLWAAGDTTYRKYLPNLVASFTIGGKVLRRVNVFRFLPGLHTLEQVHEQHAALDARHLAWMFKRLLTVLGFAHRHGTLHGAVLPCHVLIDSAGHGLQLAGWGHSAGIARHIRAVPARYLSWYPPEVLTKRRASPATDLFLAARCMVYLAGGDALTNRMPDSVPLPMQRFFESCLLEGVRMRPNNAWRLLDEFDDLLRQLYGAPRFHELVMN